MAFIPDLSPCTYFGNIDKLIAVGWLDEQQPFSTGTISVEFATKLLSLLMNAWQPVLFRGFHTCTYCPPPYYPPFDARIMHRSGLIGQNVGEPIAPAQRLLYNALTQHEDTIRSGWKNLFVPGEGCVFAAPSMIAHYIAQHDYAPPDVFCEAIMRCPPMLSKDYFAAIEQNGARALLEEYRDWQAQNLRYFFREPEKQDQAVLLEQEINLLNRLLEPR